MNDDLLALDAFRLNHGQARWVLQHLGLRAGDDDARLDSWLKYARRMGVPFWPKELGQGTGSCREVGGTYGSPRLQEVIPS